MSEDVIKKYQGLVDEKKKLENALTSAKAVSAEKKAQWDRFLVDIKTKFGVDDLEQLKKLHLDVVAKMEGIVKTVESKMAEVKQ
jgi:hypothetical protein